MTVSLGELANKPLVPNGTHDPGNGVREPAEKADSNDKTDRQPALPQTSIQQANANLVDYMMAALGDGRVQSKALYSRLSWSYWLLITMAVIVFGVGVALLSSPLWLPATVHAGSSFDWFAFVFPPTLGIANLLGLYLYNPMRRISLLMGTMTQLVVILNQYHIRVALRIVECDITDRPTIGTAAEELQTLADYSLGAIDRYFGRAANEQLSETQADAGPARG